MLINIPYNHDNPIITDSEYDILKEELEDRDPYHKLLTQINPIIKIDF